MVESFLVESTITFAESTLTESVFTTGESVFTTGVEPLLHAAKKPATAKIAINFVTYRCENYITINVITKA